MLDMLEWRAKVDQKCIFVSFSWSILDFFTGYEHFLDSMEAA